ncbi:LysE family translocator [Sedimenticola hydrogenitrophicus]|uniref:LysE family translocator n=1 Tax=Sedimenticola hydrogenitrophicus TaxID=2967975 RepID=UPI0023B1E6AC|nr:LysE family translocator [Sedimenticola hydrogenitrophicus]
MSAESALAFFAAIFIFSITPGPGVFAILARAMTEGATACFTLGLGMAISDIIYLVFACYGLAAIAEHWGGLFTVIRVLGAAYLLYLGWRMWRTRPSLATEADAVKSSDQVRSFIQGFLISASNPKVILFYIAFLPTFMDLSVLTTGDIILASVITLVGLMLGLMLIAVTASWARRKFRSERAMRGLNRVAGSIMMAAGAYIGLRH